MKVRYYLSVGHNFLEKHLRLTYCPIYWSFLSSLFHPFSPSLCSLPCPFLSSLFHSFSSLCSLPCPFLSSLFHPFSLFCSLPCPFLFHPFSPSLSSLPCPFLYLWIHLLPHHHLVNGIETIKIF